MPERDGGGPPSGSRRKQIVTATKQDHQCRHCSPDDRRVGVVVIARLIVSKYIVQVMSPWEVREVVKGFPDRTWDAGHRCWLVPVAFTDALAEALRGAGCTVYLQGVDGQPWATGNDAPHGTRSTPADDWADTVFAAVGEDRQEAVFKALSKVLHPDTGGDHVLMVELVAARERAVFRRRSAS